MHTVQLLNHIVAGNHLLAYLIIFLVTIVEGEVIAIAAGMLILLNALNLWICLIIIFIGGMVKTFSGYFIGGLLQKKYNHLKFFRFIEKKVFSVFPHFKEKPFWSIFLSKFLVGINHSVLIFSGYQKINFRTYFKAEFLSTVIWAPLFILAGYFFSYTALRITKRLSEFFLIIILCTIGLFLLDRLVTIVVDIVENFKNNNGNKN